MNRPPAGGGDAVHPMDRPRAGDGDPVSFIDRSPGPPGVGRDAAVALLRAMLEIASPSGEEAPLARFLAGALPGLGFRTRIDPVGNLIAETGPATGPTIMLLGHIDTVPGRVPVRTDGDRLYGRGAVDAKGPLATMICAAAGAGVPARVVVVGAVQEETPRSLGAMEIRRSHPPPDALLVAEPSGWSNVVLGYRGKLDLRYRVTCPAGHPTSPGPRAAELAARCWSTLTTLLGPAAGHLSFGQPGGTLVSISGDLSRAEASMSVRTPPGFDTDALLAQLRAALPAGTVSVTNVVAACRTGRRDPVVRALTAGIRGQGGRPGLRVKTGTSDMNTLAEVWSVPMATYGPGDSSLDHTDHEHIRIGEYLAGIAVVTTALTEWYASLAPDATTIAEPAPDGAVNA